MDKFVVDANVAISSLISNGVCSKCLSENASIDKFELIAPEFLFEEIKKNKSKVLKFTNLSEQEFEQAYQFLLDEISLIPCKEFIEFLDKAKRLSPHHKDAPYIALCLATNSPILTGDKGLLDLDNSIELVSPREFIELLSK